MSYMSYSESGYQLIYMTNIYIFLPAYYLAKVILLLNIIAQYKQTIYNNISYSPFFEQEATNENV